MNVNDLPNTHTATTANLIVGDDEFATMILEVIQGL